MYDIKALYEATNVQEAIALRSKHPQARILAGGSDVLVQVREGKLRGAELISIYGLDELRTICLDEDGALRIGSLCSFSTLEENNLVQKYCTPLSEAAAQVGGPQIRNLGTIGGNTCNGITSADSASSLFAYDALVELMGPNGARRIPIQDFYLKAGVVDVREGEIQVAIILPKQSTENTYGHYIKYGMRKSMDIATLGTSVNVQLSEDCKVVKRVRVAFGVAGPIPLRAEHAEKEINGQTLTADLPRRLAQLICKDINPRDSWRASRAFRMHIAEHSTELAFEKAVLRAGGVL